MLTCRHSGKAPPVPPDLPAQTTGTAKRCPGETTRAHRSTTSRRRFPHSSMGRSQRPTPYLSVVLLDWVRHLRDGGARDVASLGLGAEEHLAGPDVAAPQPRTTHTCVTTQRARRARGTPRICPHAWRSLTGSSWSGPASLAALRFCRSHRPAATSPSRRTRTPASWKRRGCRPQTGCT